MPTSEVTLRRATVADANALSAFAARVFALGGRPNADPADIAAHIAKHLTPERFRELINDSNVVLIVAEVSKQLVGYSALVRQCIHALIKAESVSELRRLYVDPQHHGQGIADALMREALAHAHPVVWLSVFSENARGIRFYERWGFRTFGKQYFMVGNDPQQDLLMRRG
jgi:diamine N-acetyltransferase